MPTFTPRGLIGRNRAALGGASRVRPEPLKASPPDPSPRLGRVSIVLARRDDPEVACCADKLVMLPRCGDLLAEGHGAEVTAA